MFELVAGHTGGDDGTARHRPTIIGKDISRKWPTTVPGKQGGRDIRDALGPDATVGAVRGHDRVQSAQFGQSGDHLVPGHDPWLAFVRIEEEVTLHTEHSIPGVELEPSAGRLVAAGQLVDRGRHEGILGPRHLGGTIPRRSGAGTLGCGRHRFGRPSPPPKYSPEGPRPPAGAVPRPAGAGTLGCGRYRFVRPSKPPKYALDSLEGRPTGICGAQVDGAAGDEL